MFSSERDYFAEAHNTFRPLINKSSREMVRAMPPLSERQDGERRQRALRMQRLTDSVDEARRKEETFTPATNTTRSHHSNSNRNSSNTGGGGGGIGKERRSGATPRDSKYSPLAERNVNQRVNDAHGRKLAASGAETRTPPPHPPSNGRAQSTPASASPEDKRRVTETIQRLWGRYAAGGSEMSPTNVRAALRELGIGADTLDAGEALVSKFMIALGIDSSPGGEKHCVKYDRFVKVLTVVLEAGVASTSAKSSPNTAAKPARVTPTMRRQGSASGGKHNENTNTTHAMYRDPEEQHSEGTPVNNPHPRNSARALDFEGEARLGGEQRGGNVNENGNDDSEVEEMCSTRSGSCLSGRSCSTAAPSVSRPPSRERSTSTTRQLQERFASLRGVHDAFASTPPAHRKTPQRDDPRAAAGQPTSNTHNFFEERRLARERLNVRGTGDHPNRNTTTAASAPKSETIRKEVKNQPYVPKAERDRKECTSAPNVAQFHRHRDALAWWLHPPTATSPEKTQPSATAPHASDDSRVSSHSTTTVGSDDWRGTRSRRNSHTGRKLFDKSSTQPTPVKAAVKPVDAHHPLSLAPGFEKAVKRMIDGRQQQKAAFAESLRDTTRLSKWGSYRGASKNSSEPMSLLSQPRRDADHLVLSSVSGSNATSGNDDDDDDDGNTGANAFIDDDDDWEPTVSQPFALRSERRRQQREEGKVLFYVDVDLPNGKTGRIGVHLGDSARKLAETFCCVYSLPRDTRRELETMLSTRMVEMGSVSRHSMWK